MKYAHILDGTITEFRDYPEPPECKHIDGLPVLRPVVDIPPPAFDADTQRLEAVQSIFDDRVERSFRVLALLPAELSSNLAQAKQMARADVDSFHGSSLMALVGNPSQAEKDSWTLKLATAKAVLAEAAVSAEGAAFLTGLGLVSTADQLAWANKVIGNATRYAALVGAADQLRGQAMAGILAAATPTGVQAVLDAVRTAAEQSMAGLQA